MSRRRIIILGSALIAVVLVIAGGGVLGSYALGLAALHNHANLSVAQSCQHWRWIYAATAHDGTAALRAAVGRTLAQLGCPR